MIERPLRQRSKLFTVIEMDIVKRNAILIKHILRKEISLRMRNSVDQQG